MLGCYPLKSVKREPISQSRGKEHRKVGEQGAMIARQQKQIGTLTTGLQKVSAQLAAASLSLADLKRANSPQDESAVADLRRKWSTIPGNASGSHAYART